MINKAEEAAFRFPSLSGKTFIRTSKEGGGTVPRKIKQKFPSLSGKTFIRTSDQITVFSKALERVSIPFREDLHSDAETVRALISNGAVSIPFREELHSDRR